MVDTGAYISEKEYLYNEEHKLCRINDYRNEELISYMKYRWEGTAQYGDVYDETGNCLIEESYDVGGGLIRRMRYEYVGTDGSVSGEMPEYESAE